jgi:hypothetical protein
MSDYELLNKIRHQIGRRIDEISLKPIIKEKDEFRRQGLEEAWRIVDLACIEALSREPKGADGENR